MMRLTIISAAIAACLFNVPIAAQQPTGMLVRGTVLERGTGRAVEGATVLLADSLRVTTDATGDFLFRGVPPGTHSIVVEAQGYSTARTRLLVIGPEEASVTIRLDVAPVMLDPLAVTPRRSTLRGTVSSSETGRRVPYAAAILRGTGEASANDNGIFRFSDIAQGEHELRVEAFGWLPYRTDLVLEGDSMLAITLERDPIMQRVIEEQLARIDARSRGEPGRRHIIDRRWFEESRYVTAFEVLSARGPTSACPGCRRRGSVSARADGGRSIPGGGEAVYIDDVRVCGVALLRLYPAAMFERIEVLNNGQQIRAYTSAFIERMLAGRQPLAGLSPPGWDQPMRC